MKINPILAIDSYKLAHISMYPEQIKETYLNLTPRGTTLDDAIKQALVTINLNKDTDDKPIHTEPTLR